MSKYRDFDTGWRERKQEPIRFRARGLDFELPPSLPAIVPLRAVQLRDEHGVDGNVPEADAIELARQLFGEEQFSRLLGSNITVDELGDVIRWVLELYTGGTGESGNPLAPAPKAATGAE